MHEKISIVDICAASTRSDLVADDPEQGGEDAAAAKVRDRSLRLWNSGHRNDLCARLHDVEHLVQGLATDQVEAGVKYVPGLGYVLRRIIDHFVAAERAHQRLTSFRSRCRGVRAEPFGDLYCEGADASGGARDEHFL